MEAPGSDRVEVKALVACTSVAAARIKLECRAAVLWQQQADKEMPHTPAPSSRLTVPATQPFVQQGRMQQLVTTHHMAAAYNWTQKQYVFIQGRHTCVTRMRRSRSASSYQ